MKSKQVGGVVEQHFGRGSVTRLGCLVRAQVLKELADDLRVLEARNNADRSSTLLTLPDFDSEYPPLPLCPGGDAVSIAYALDFLLFSAWTGLPGTTYSRSVLFGEKTP